MTPRPLKALLLTALLLAPACKKDEPAPPEPAQADRREPWTEKRTKDLGKVAVPGGEYSLELRHEPGEGGLARLSLWLSGGDKARAVWQEDLPLAGRDALWAAPTLLAPEAVPDGRLALSLDGGQTFRIIYRGQVPVPLLDAHARVPGAGGVPDWSKAPDVDAWAAGVLSTAVWGCDPKGRGCKSRALAGGTAHHSEPGGDELLPQFHDAEFGPALAYAEKATLSRRLAVALVDAAVSYQPGLDEAGLKRLGAAAARALAEGGPLGPEERKALRLRVTLARDEAKKKPPEQLSPRVSIATLLEGTSP